jgi:glyceraldehyde-3-phosphate dehydrogenase (NAD(P))
MSFDQNHPVRVGILGYGTIGRRLATAVTQQPDMLLVGVAGRRESTALHRAQSQGYRTYYVEDSRQHSSSGAAFEELLDSSDVLLDCTPSGIPDSYRDPIRRHPHLLTIVQGGEASDSCDVSFNSLANFSDAAKNSRIRVISCSSTGTTRMLWALQQTVRIQHAFVTLIRRAADPAKRSSTPIHALLPTMGCSHHAADVKTVLPNVNLFSVSVNCPTTLSHVIWFHVQLRKPVERESVLDGLRRVPRIMVIHGLAGTVEVREHFKNMGRYRHDHPELVVFGDTLMITNQCLTVAACVHMESITIPETIDCIRAGCEIQLDRWQSIRLTDESLGILHSDEKAYESW